MYLQFVSSVTSLSSVIPLLLLFPLSVLRPLSPGDWVNSSEWQAEPGCSWWLGGPPQMGSVSRGRWRRRIWGALAPTKGMASWAWLLAAVLLSLLTVSVARPPLTATKEEEATLEPEGKQPQQQGEGKGGGEGGQPFVGFVFRGQV